MQYSTPGRLGPADALDALAAAVEAIGWKPALLEPLLARAWDALFASCLSRTILIASSEPELLELTDSAAVGCGDYAAETVNRLLDALQQGDYDTVEAIICMVD
jgi:hypothetical protein